MIERLGRRLTGSVLLWDTLLTLLALYLSSRLVLGVQQSGDRLPVQPSWELYASVIGIWFVVFRVLRPQRALFFNALPDALGRLVLAVALSLLAFGGVLFLLASAFSQAQWLAFGLIDVVFVLALHALVRFNYRLRSRYRKQQRTLLVGAGQEARHLIQEFEHRPWIGLQVVGYTSDTPAPDSPLPVFGTIAETPRVVVEQAIDEIVFVTQDRAVVESLSLQLIQHPVMLHMVPGVLDLAFTRTPVESLGGIPLVSLRESALTESQRLFKRLFDLAAGSLLLLVAAPLLLVIAVLIKLDSPGPVFFCQERIGEHGRHFRMYKFRTMCRDAEERLADVAPRDARGLLIHKRADDPRLTRVGRWLRRASLDELPNLFNVLRGEMSLVGPRPELPALAAAYEPWQWQRVRVPAGMTGWWQVNGRSDKPMHLHTEDDLFYIQNYSLWLDLRILWMTIPAVIKGRGAF